MRIIITIILLVAITNFISSENDESPDASIFTDMDSDGFTNDIDCNDMDKFVYPGAPEID